MSKQSQALLMGAMSQTRKSNMTPQEKRKQDKLQRALRYRNGMPSGISLKVLAAVNAEKSVNYLDLENYCKARWGVSLSRRQIYNAVHYLRKTRRITHFTVDIQPI